MWRSVGRGALVLLAAACALATTAIAPLSLSNSVVTDHARLADMPAGEVGTFLDSHYGLTADALDADPAKVAAWWTSVNWTQRPRLIQRMPEVLGNLAGLDYASRDRANRLQLTRDLADAQRMIALRPGDSSARLSLSALSAISGALSAVDTVGRYLVELTSDSPPLAAIAIGNLDSAQQVTFAVPGMGTFANDMQLWSRAAQNIFNAQSAAGAPHNHSVVAWIGYRTPPVGVEATRDNYARRGALLLTRDIQGVRAARGDGLQPIINIVAHSYGGTTAALALADTDLGIHSFVMLGSAGVDTRISTVASLHAAAVYAGEAARDVEAWWGRLDRRDPASSAFGAIPLDVESRNGLIGVTGHDPILHSPWNDDPASSLWTRYSDTKTRERLYAAHMASFGYLDSGTESLARVGAATTTPIVRGHAAAPVRRGVTTAP